MTNKQEEVLKYVAHRGHSPSEVGGRGGLNRASCRYLFANQLIHMWINSLDGATLATITVKGLDVARSLS